MTDGQANYESSAFSGDARGSDGSLMAFDDLFADRQPHAGSFIFPSSMQSLEQLKDAFSILILEPDAVVGEDQFAVGGLIKNAVWRTSPFDLQMRSCSGTVKLQSIAQQVLEELSHL